MTDEPYDLQALRCAAEFFEDLATGADAAPLAFAQAIRRVIADAELEAEIAADMAADWDAENSPIIQSSWERFKASMPVAKVINDNQPGNHAIIQVLADPPTLPVGTLLFSSLQAVKDNAMVLEMLTQDNTNV